MKISRIIEELEITIEKYGDIDAMVIVSAPQKINILGDIEGEAFRLERALFEGESGPELAFLKIKYTDDIKKTMKEPSFVDKVNGFKGKT